jgi:hypothetical protein
MLHVGAALHQSAARLHSSWSSVFLFSCLNVRQLDRRESGPSIHIVRSVFMFSKDQMYS